MPDMKVEKNAGSFYILGYLLELIVDIWQFDFLFDFFILTFGEFGPNFP